MVENGIKTYLKQPHNILSEHAKPGPASEPEFDFMPDPVPNSNLDPVLDSRPDPTIDHIPSHGWSEQPSCDPQDREWTLLFGWNLDPWTPSLLLPPVTSEEIESYYLWKAATSIREALDAGNFVTIYSSL